MRTPQQEREDSVNDIQNAPNQKQATLVSVSPVESRYLKYAEIKAIIDEIEYLNYGIENQPNVHFARAKKLIELWEMKKNGFYFGELSIDHVLKSLNIAVDVAIKEIDKEHEQDSLLLRCMFYANEGDKMRALHDLNRAKTFSVSSDLIWKGYIASKIDKAEAKINALVDVQLSGSATESAFVSQNDIASFIKEIEIQELHNKIALADMIPPTSSEYQNVERIKVKSRSRLAQIQRTTAQVLATALPAAKNPLIHMQASAVTPAKLSAAIKSPQRIYDDIQRTSNRISEIDERIFNKYTTRNCYWQRTLMLIELWNEKKTGHYPGELSDEHILKSFNSVIMEDTNDPTYWVKRGNFYAQLGDRACALADYEKAKSLPVPENVLAAYCYNNELSDLEKAIDALTVRSSQLQQTLIPLTIEEIKIQKLQREIALFDMQLAMTPNQAESLVSKAYAFSQLAGLLQWEASVAEKVTRAYDAAIQCAPNTFLFLRRAGSHLKQNHFDAALQDIYVGTGMPHQLNMQENILKYINAIFLANYKNDAALQNTFERFRVEKNITETTVEAWFTALAKQYQPVVIEDPARHEIRLLQQQLQEQKKTHDAQIAELREHVASLQQRAQRASVETNFGTSSALFVKRDAQTQTSEMVTRGMQCPLFVP